MRGLRIGSLMMSRPASNVCARIGGLFALALMLLYTFPVSAAWTNTRFHIEGLSGAEKTFLETYLSEVGRLYSQWDFEPTTLETDSIDGEDIYVVRFTKEKHEGKGTVALSYKRGCTNQKPTSSIYVPIIPLYFDAQGQMTDKLLQDLAHELFHTVQYAYPMFYKNNCDVHEWITEATAEAVGIEAARRVYGVGPVSACQIGRRSYQKEIRNQVIWPRPGCDKPNGYKNPYTTNAFWRFLGEYTAHDSRPEAMRHRWPDYRYLHELLKHPLQGLSREEEYRWLDEALDEKLGFQFAATYASFASTFADYWEKPRRSKYPEYKEPNNEEEEDWFRGKWLKALFGECVPLTASLDVNPIASDDFEVEAVGSRCIEVIPDLSASIDYVFIAGGGSGVDFDAFTISKVSGEERVIPRPLQSGDEPGSSWRFHVDAQAGKAAYFILTNVSSIAEASKNQTLNLRLVPEGISSSLDAQAPPSGTNPTGNSNQNSPPSGSQPGQATPRDTEAAKKADEDFDKGFDTVHWQTSVRAVDLPKCDRPFVARACGAATSIGMLRNIGNTGMLTEALRPEMSLERMVDVMGGVAAQGGGNINSKLYEAHVRNQSTDGASISLVFPRIDYGFTGSFSNARIDVSKAITEQNKNPGSYEAIGPGYVGECGEGYFPQTGKVTIDEASRQVLRGSYSATLIDNSTMDGCESLSIAKSVTGRFSIALPVLGDNKARHTVTEDDVDDLIEDINQMVPGLYTGELGERARAVAKQKLREREERRQAREAAREAVVEVNCDCDCATQETAEPVCQQRCAPVYDICNNHPDAERYRWLNAPPTVDEVAQAEILRVQFEAALRARNTDPAIINTYLELFDSLPRLELKQDMAEPFMQ